MFFRNMTLMRKTLMLVVGALCASTVFATFAFLIAGRTTANNLELDKAVENITKIAETIENNPSILSQSSNLIFGEESITDDSIFLLNSKGYIIYPNYDMTLNASETKALKYVSTHLCSLDVENKQDIFNIGNLKSIVIVQKPITINDGHFILVSISDSNEIDDTITEYVNILLLSTLAAAFFMLLPVTLMVKHILEPIQEVNRVAKEFGKGNFDIKAEERFPGEVGELATTVNILSERLSKSINELTIERNRLEDIFNVISEGIVVFNEEASPIIVNEMMKSIFSRVPKRNLFTDRLQLIPFDEVWADIDDCITNGQKKDRVMEGPEFAYAIVIIPKFDIEDKTKCIGATGFFRDVFDELKLERTRRDYVANISHELRTPLQTLRGLIEPLSDGLVKKEEDRQRYYSIIMNETMRLSRLIDDMLELSKLQSRTLAFKTFPIDMNQLLSELETKFMPIMRDAGIKFRVLFNTGRLPTVMGNPDRVEQILVILLDNAKKYTPDGGSITIISEFNEQDNKVHISVKDSGQGIHEYDIDHIFDRFFKADRARGKKGTGLGLSIAKELLTYMGEDITVQSEYGVGTTFTFTLKKAEARNAWKQ